MNDNALAGGISGIFARIVSTPLDVVKIRFQLQEESISKKNVNSKYTGILQSVRTIVREEGVNALWKGSLPGIAMYFVYGGVQFSSYEWITRTLRERLKFSGSTGLNFIGGCCGGATAVVICHPLDVLRTRLVSQGKEKHYRSILSAIRLMYLENGFLTFYKGLTPGLLLIVPQAGMNFGFYTFFRNVWRSYFSDPSAAANSSTVLQGSKGIESLVCGGLAGVTSKTLTLPLDLIKKRLQVQGFEVARGHFGQVTRYSGVLDALQKILRQEGMLAFYKGTSPGLFKTSLTVSVSFYVYEYMLILLKELKS